MLVGRRQGQAGALGGVGAAAELDEVRQQEPFAGSGRQPQPYQVGLNGAAELVGRLAQVGQQVGAFRNEPLEGQGFSGVFAGVGMRVAAPEVLEQQLAAGQVVREQVAAAEALQFGKDGGELGVFWQRSLEGGRHGGSGDGRKWAFAPVQKGDFSPVGLAEGCCGSGGLVKGGRGRMATGADPNGGASAQGGAMWRDARVARHFNWRDTDFARHPIGAIGPIRAMINAGDDSIAPHLLRLLHGQPAGLPMSQLHAQLAPPVATRTLQRHLAALVRTGQLVALGTGRATRYALAHPNTPAPAGNLGDDLPDYAAVLPLSSHALAIAAAVRRPLALREPVSYQLELLEAYRPGHTWYLPERLRQSLALLGRGAHAADVAGTFAKEILNRLLIDLSWASSKLEGNTYTRLDTERLVAYGESAQGHDAIEAQMILNHKAAIEYLVDRAASLDLGPTTLLELHALLSDGLLRDPAASGRLRRRAVGIGGSVYLPMALPQRLEQVFGLLCATANAIPDPFEQALFVMVHLPYLQPFEDVNKRVSRLAANVPLVRQNLVPLAFLDLPEQAYTDAILGIYELGRIDLMRDVFVWAYERSCQHYAAVERQLVPPEPLRLKYRRQLGEVVRAVVASGNPADETQVLALVPDSVAEPDRDGFVQVAMVELDALHEGNAVRFGLSGLAVAGWRRGQTG